MATGTTTPHDTGRHTAPRGLHGEARQPVTPQERNAVNRLRTTMIPVITVAVITGDTSN